jgi:hypothetical protein
MEGLLATVESLGPKMSGIVGDRAEAIFESLQNKATAAWTNHGQDILAIKRIAQFDGDYQKFLTSVHSEQVKRFTEANPGRILHPELERQISYLRDNNNIRFVDLDTMAAKLERIVKQEPYWQGLSDVQISRLWHADGILMAHENNIADGAIIGPDDKKTCPVCQRMLGTHVRIEQAREKIIRDIGLLDPDAYARAWRFPRIQDIDNMSPKARADKGYLAPFHNRCRHSVAWTTSKSVVTSKPVTTPAEKPGYRLRKGYVGIHYPEQFASKADAARWVRLNVADKLLLDKEVNLDFVNAALGHLRIVNQVAPLRSPLTSLQVTELPTNTNGRFIVRSSGKTELQLNKAREIEFMSVAERQARAVNALTQDIDAWRGMRETLPGMSDQIEQTLKIKETALKKIQSSPPSRPEVTFSVSSSISDSPAGGTMVHEYGHAWHYQYDDKVRKQFGIRYYKDRGSKFENELIAKYRVSEYAKTNWEECFAENFSLYFHGEVKRMHADMVKFFDAMFPRLRFGQRLTPEIYEA